MKFNSWFDKGMTFEEYRNNMQVNQSELSHVYDQLIFTEDDITEFEKLEERKWRGLVLTADWCGDAALCVPILQRIAELGKIELRFLIRDNNLELMDQYLTNGTSRSIPIFIFIDQNDQEKMVWGPRSPLVQDFITSLRDELPLSDSPDFQEKQMNMFRQFKERIVSDPTIWRSVMDSVKSKL